ncbi:MAG: lysoplasmalogenase [Pyrinomonadaceae bacterium]|nr:lysoplasmalogenase [Sphingobacteriaceae bacterium]
MFKRHKTFNTCYILIWVLNVYALATQNEILRMVSMPLIGMSLMFYLLIKTKIEDNFQKLIFVGLVVSLAGDIQLLFSTGTEFYFYTAIIAAFIGYILYALAYFIDFRKDFKGTRRIGNGLALVLLISICTFFFSAHKNLLDFRYPIIIYFSILSVMTILSGYRHQRVNRLSFKLILTGSFAFVISDLSITYYHFINKEAIMMITYLLTYLIAQYLVIMGTIERKSSNSL